MPDSGIRWGLDPAWRIDWVRRCIGFGAYETALRTGVLDLRSSSNEINVANTVLDDKIRSVSLACNPIFSLYVKVVSPQGDYDGTFLSTIRWLVIKEHWR